MGKVTITFFIFSFWVLAVLGLHWALTVTRGLLFICHRRASLVGWRAHRLSSCGAKITVTLDLDIFTPNRKLKPLGGQSPGLGLMVWGAPR